MMNNDQISTLMFIKDDSVVDLLMKEYSILQGKIDKIGEFRFTIKGWALTLNTGAVVAAFATSLHAITAILLVFGLLFVLWRLEWRQIRLSNIFQDRALRIEKIIGRRLEAHGLRRSDFISLMRIPGIAHELRNPFDARRADRIAASSLSLRGQFSAKILRMSPIVAFRRSSMWKKLLSSDFLFYVLILIISAIFIWFQHARTTPNKSDGDKGHTQRISRAENSTNSIGREEI
jgi:hypothetical protein